MKSECRVLPHLNQLFLLNQEHSSHRKKIKEIKRKQSKISNLHLEQIKSRRSSENTSVVSISQRSSRITEYKKIAKSCSLKKNADIGSLPIPEFPKKQFQIPQWMSPYRRRVEREKIMENLRLGDKIIHSISKLRAQSMKKEYEKIHAIKNRLCRYQRNPESTQVMLKSEKSLRSYHSKTPRLNKDDQIKNKLFTQGDQIPKRSIQINLRNRTQQSKSQMARRSFQFKKETAHRIWKQRNWVHTNIQQTKSNRNSELKNPYETEKHTSKESNLKNKLYSIVNKTHNLKKKPSRKLPQQLHQITLT